MNVCKQTTNFRQTILSLSKKLAVTMALLLTLGASYSFANPTDGVSGEIKTSFQRNFQHAQILNTEVSKAFTKLTFRMDGLILSAFYSKGGELLAVTHNIVSTQLPLNLLKSLKNDYSGYWITELFEFNGDGGSSYYVSLESANGKVTLRSSDDNWEVYSSVKK
jgi:hypothetical protein